MNKYFKENWFKIGLSLAFLFVVSSFAYKFGVNQRSKEESIPSNNIATQETNVLATQNNPQEPVIEQYGVEAIQVGGIGSRINQITPYLLDDQGFLRPPEDWGRASFNRAGDIMDVNCKDGYYITACKSSSGNEAILDNVIGCRVMLEDKVQNKANIECIKLNTESADKHSEEVTFNKPIDIVWQGKIISTMVSGSDYGIKKIPEDKNFPFFYAYTGNELNDRLEGNVKVDGKWKGITCAYENTIFNRCVPDVEVINIEKTK